LVPLYLWAYQVTLIGNLRGQGKMFFEIVWIRTRDWWIEIFTFVIVYFFLWSEFLSWLLCCRFSFKPCEDCLIFNKNLKCRTEFVYLRKKRENKAQKIHQKEWVYYWSFICFLCLQWVSLRRISNLLFLHLRRIPEK